MSYCMFLDDDMVYRHPPENGKLWIRVQSTDEAIKLVKEKGWPEHISFDHDLGENDTSMIFIRWMIEVLLDTGSSLPFTYTVHSANPVGFQNITALLLAYKNFGAN